jgi:hypothetical protein
MAKQKEKTKVRESKPLAETPNYDYDPTDLAKNLKKIQSDSSARIAASNANRKANSDKRREAMSSKGKQSGGSLYGLNASFGGKIVK